MNSKHDSRKLLKAANPTGGPVRGTTAVAAEHRSKSITSQRPASSQHQGHSLLHDSVPPRGGSSSPPIKIKREQLDSSPTFLTGGSPRSHSHSQYHPHASDAVTPAKRQSAEPDQWPNTKPRSGSSSPNYDSQQYDPDHPRFHSDSVQKARSPTASPSQSAHQTPFSSPRLSHQLHAMSHQTPQHPVPYLDPERRNIDPSPQADEAYSEDDIDDVQPLMVLQPETRPISQEQLVNEVKGIYAGLVMVEKKCVEICQQQAKTTNKLSNEQWQALIALHRTLLHEHHDFFLASQHPTASAALRRLPTKYAMPARMWRHGIHSFLELLRHRLPYSLEHMLSFVYLAYQMMGLLMESVPAFHETWIECLGDLARYRMAIEEADMRDRETWSNCARMWYNKAADRSPDTGRIQHHLAVLARPNIACQLFYYSKALITVNPFPNARDSIMLLFNPLLLDPSATPSQKAKLEQTLTKYSKFESSLVSAAALLFTKGSIHEYCVHITRFTSELDNHITRSASNFKVQGAEVASALIACLLDFGSDSNYLWRTLRAHYEKLQGTHTQQSANDFVATIDPTIKESSHRKFWRDGSISARDFQKAAPPAGDLPNLKFTSADQITSYVLPVWSTTVSIVASKVGDRNALPFIHLTLAFLWSLSYVPGALIYLENYVPWAKLVLSLNTLSRSGVVDARVESKEFPQQQSGTGRQLPEDFPIRGLIWAPYYFPADFFQGNVVDEDERTLELPSHAAPRAERCLWLGVRLASLNRYMTYNVSTKQFACTEYALSLGNAPIDTLHVQTPANGRDVPMIDV